MSSVNDAVPSGVGRPLGVQAVPYDHLKQIAQLLGAAIQGGNKEMAKQLAERLADEKVKVNVEVDAETHEQRAKELRFSVKVHIEDRESSGCSINLKVQTSDTIGDLKKKMMLEYEFPLEVQRWIIGKRIPKDEETLSKCGVKGPGHTVYLYLITAKSVNLTREDYIKEKELNLGGSGRLVLPEMASGDYMTMGAPYRQSLCQRVIPAQTPSRQQSTLSNVSSGSNISAVAENTPVRNSSQNDIPLLDPHSLRHKTTLPAQPPLGSAHQNIWNHEENVLVGGGGPEIPGQLQQTETPPRPAREVPQHTSIGWECPVCTFINKPFRPGCEICGEVRPPGYKIPVGYIMSDEEQRWLAEAERTEQLTREAQMQRGEVGEMNNNREELTEDQLDLILRFNDAVQNLQQRSSNAGEADFPPELPPPFRGQDIPDAELFVPSDEDNSAIS